MTGAAPRPRRAVLLMAYGGPECLEDVEPFLRDVRGGRPTPPELVEEVRARYAAIGGRSPLLEITRAQAAALGAELNRLGQAEWTAYVGMRHWHPYIADAVREIAAAGHRRVVALCLAPQYSRMSIGAYFAKLDDALAELDDPPEVSRIQSWHDHPGFLDAVAEKVADGLARLPVPPAESHVVFTAHSLPRRIVEAGDPYDDQLRATARRVADRAAARAGASFPWTFCYQSVGAGGVDWLGPEVTDVVADLARAGHRHLLAAPIGFVSDHVEVLYDLDIEARAAAERHGARLSRTESLNTSAGFIGALSEVVRAAVRRG